MHRDKGTLRMQNLKKVCCQIFIDRLGSSERSLPVSSHKSPHCGFGSVFRVGVCKSLLKSKEGLLDVHQPI